jgi:anti-anti-sigma factor
MKYSIKTLYQVVILEINGPWVNGPRDYLVHKEVKRSLMQAIEAGACNVIVDLKNCRFAASGGIGGLVSLKASTAARGGKVILCCVNDRVRRALVVSGLWNHLESYTTREEALAALPRVFKAS